MTVDVVIYERVARADLLVILAGYRNTILKKRSWQLPATLTATLGTARVTGSFSDPSFGVSGEFWKTLFAIGTVISALVLIIMLFDARLDDTPDAALECLVMCPDDDDQSESDAAINIE